MKKQLLVAAVLSTTALFGCSSVQNPLDTVGTDQDIYDEYAAQCTFKDGKTPASKWVCGFPIDDYPISEVGYSEAGNRAEASAIARIELARRLRSDVESVEQVDTQTFGRQERQEYSSRSRITVDGEVYNTRVVLRQVDPTTQGLYVLVVAEVAAYEQSLRKAQQRQDTEMPEPSAKLDE